LVKKIKCTLERKLGGLHTFLPYVKDYVETFTGKSITTTQWKDHLYGYWSQHGGTEKIQILDKIDWDAWFYGEGTELPVHMEYDITLAETAYILAGKWDSARDQDISNLEFKSTDLNDFNSNQIGQSDRLCLNYFYQFFYSSGISGENANLSSFAIKFDSPSWQNLSVFGYSKC